MAGTFSVAWCSSFERRGGAILRPRRLESAYRAPALFAETFCAAAQFEQSQVDERFAVSGLAADVVYVCSHGEAPSNGHSFRLYLEKGYADLSGIEASVIVVDACDLVDGALDQWWTSTQFHPKLRLVLGFGSQATMDRGSSLRARKLADALLAGNGIVDAWHDAVVSTAVYGAMGSYDKPVAIALGDADFDVAGATHWNLSDLSERLLPIPAVARLL